MGLFDYTKNAPIGLLSQHFTAAHNRDSFAHTNALLKRPCPMPPVMAHFWTAEDTVILGMQDLRLPQLPQALKTLASWHPFVRNSGGLGVIADNGVLNASLFLPADAELTIQAAYQLMADWIAQALPEATVTVGEVTRSYCPGSFDLSINGQKFAGLAQRRTSAGIAVMAYLSITGDQQARGQVMRRFYQRGDAQTATKFHFPDIDPASMQSLDQLLNLPLTVGTMQARLVHALENGAAVKPVPEILHDPAYIQALDAAQADMAERQEALSEH